MSILVTGASGFVGQHLIRFLAHKKKRVIGVYLSHKPHFIHQHVRYVRCDLTHFQSVLHLVKRTKPTHVFHLAAQGSPSLSWKYPFETMTRNLLSTMYLMESIRQSDVQPKVVFASSAHVYGESFNKNKILNEEDQVIPLDPYGASKLQAELVVLQYARQFQIPSVIIRATAHTGKGQAPNFAISNFSRQIALIEKGKAKPILFAGNLHVRRAFIAVEDMVEAYWLAMTRGKSGEIYNVGGEDVRPMSFWITELLKMSHVRIKVTMAAARKRLIEPKQISISTAKFRRKTGWKVKVSSHDLLRRMLDLWRAHV